MSWVKKRILVTVKAYPERSKKYGTAVCTAGITDEGEWIRLYPLTTRSFSGDNKISKYDWIEVECRKVKREKLGRKESYKVREETIKIVDRSLSRRNFDWKGRNDIVLKNVSSSIEFLEEKFKEDRTSSVLLNRKRC